MMTLGHPGFEAGAHFALVLAIAACGSSDSSAPPAPDARPPLARPASLPVLDSVSSIATGLDHSCALRAGRVYCWGQSLARGSDSRTAREVRELPTIVTIDSAGRRVCAVSDVGELYCWGEVLAEGAQGVRGQVYVHPPGGGISPELAIRWGRLAKLDFGRRITRVAVGMIHICALDDQRDLYCWGSDSGGQLTAPTPVRAAERIAEDVENVEVGQGWTCYVVRGKRFCRGKHPGMGELTQQQHVQMPGWIVASCGVSAQGEVFCDGRAALVFGGGPVPREPSGEQVKIAGLDQVVQLSVGYSHACAVRTDRTAWCWSGSERPHQLALPGPVRQVEAGSGHACAVLDQDGRVMCWGSSDHGQSGDPHEAPNERPIRVAPNAEPPGPIPTIAVDEAILRAKRLAEPTPSALQGTGWSVCLVQPHDTRTPCSTCQYTLRFDPRGRFVAEGSCPSLKSSVTWSGTWKRTGDRVYVREKPAPAGTVWEWNLALRGHSISGQRMVKGGGPSYAVSGGKQ